LIVPAECFAWSHITGIDTYAPWNRVINAWLQTMERIDFDMNML
jgi:hypothetical protein